MRSLPGNPTHLGSPGAENPSGVIVSVQRLSTEDGPGIRTTVFLKRCPLSCRWCQNPESISEQSQLQWFSVRCIGCASCVTACSAGNLAMTGSGLSINRLRCTGCGTCASRCPSNALELAGREISAARLAEELERDKAFYEQSGGGVTVSGGEPLAQPLFTRALLEKLLERGIQTALDTCGFAAPAAWEQVLPLASLVLFDLKLMDPVRHRKLTGQSNELILGNFAAVVDAVRLRTRRLSLWVRTPLIPGATATRENLLAIGRFLANSAQGAVERWELCAFNNLCRDKYSRLGIEWDYALTPLMKQEELEEAAANARASGVDPGIVSVTGAARARTNA